MDARPNMGASYYEPENYIVTSQPQQQQQDLRHQGQMLPPIPHFLSTDSGSGGTPSFQLTAAAASPTAIGKPTAAASSGVPGGGCYSLTQQLVTPTSPVLGYASRNLPGQQPQSSPSRPQQQQQPPPPPLNLLSIPIGHAYTYHPSTEHSQTTGLIFNNNPITPTQSAQNVLTSSSLQTQAKPRPPRNKSKFKRFRNAFIYYVNDQRVDNETKMLKNREFLRLMSARWKVMSEIERSPYVKLAEADKKRFDDDVKKFGKYESRQRRYNKSRHINSEILGHSNPYMAGTHQYPATATGMLYNGGFCSMVAAPTRNPRSQLQFKPRFRKTARSLTNSNSKPFEL
ncbi:Non-histone chromosomal protein 6 [Coemansia spiralis]|uniref:Non-histone chromosomal protein 6 n=1 Tax=Coemansia spiralis TaxID=417178 RepID=A0A9W8L1W9_9FUNG|nr:Non-histone chromosomal protein 6 [Coemansia spiralis]